MLRDKIKKKLKFVIFARIVLGLSAIVGLILISSMAIYVFTLDLKEPVLISAPSAQIKDIEISPDAKAILRADTKEAIFTIDDANKYLKESGYAYDPDTFQDTNEKYAGDCFLSANLSNNKDKIVFSSGCLAGDLPQAWVGVVKIEYISGSGFGYPNESAYLSDTKFLIAGSGKNFIWSSDDKNITYEADLGLSGLTEIRTINAATGEIEYFGNEFIQIELPLSNDSIDNPVKISGKANVFEGTVRIRIKDDDKNILADAFTTASGAYDRLYPFEKEIAYDIPAYQTGTIEIFEESAKDGSELHKVTLPIVFKNYTDETADWKTYRNEEYGFEVKYPESVTLNIEVENISKMEDMPSGFDRENVINDKAALERGDATTRFSWGLGYQALNLDKAVGKRFIVFRAFEICDVQFAQYANIYKDDVAVFFNVSGKIGSYNEKYFIKDEICGNDLIWKDDGEENFYNDLISRKVDDVSQKQYDDFNDILSTFKFIE